MMCAGLPHVYRIFGVLGNGMKHSQEKPLLEPDKRDAKYSVPPYVVHQVHGADLSSFPS